MLKTRGYATACFGKWHAGYQPELMPLAQGFDKYVGIPYSNDMWPMCASVKYPTSKSTRPRASKVGYQGDHLDNQYSAAYVLSLRAGPVQRRWIS
ncbi:MAG: sulfatase-like hydrolase/transferase [Verrucomicrobiota bacterium]|nr:sulfatase-like hydrolase/transferase [Verrucomicrobiota bacterium]